jgi:hypothetical protein
MIPIGLGDNLETEPPSWFVGIPVIRTLAILDYISDMM